MVNLLGICIALMLVGVTLATPPEDDVCMSYRRLDGALRKCREVKRRDNTDKPAGLSYMEWYIRNACIDMPYVLLCTYNVINTCPRSVQNVVNVYMNTTYDTFCSEDSWIYRYVVPLAQQKKRYSGCARGVNFASCFANRFAKENITSTTTVADGIAIRGREMYRKTTCIAHALQEQVPTGQHCNGAWKHIYLAVLGNLMAWPRRLGTRLYPQQIAELESLTGENGAESLMDILAGL